MRCDPCATDQCELFGEIKGTLNCALHEQDKAPNDDMPEAVASAVEEDLLGENDNTITLNPKEFIPLVPLNQNLSNHLQTRYDALVADPVPAIVGEQKNWVPLPTPTLVRSTISPPCFNFIFLGSDPVRSSSYSFVPLIKALSSFVPSTEREACSFPPPEPPNQRVCKASTVKQHPRPNNLTLWPPPEPPDRSFRRLAVKFQVGHYQLLVKGYNSDFVWKDFVGMAKSLLRKMWINLPSCLETTWVKYFVYHDSFDDLDYALQVFDQMLKCLVGGRISLTTGCLNNEHRDVACDLFIDIHQMEGKSGNCFFSSMLSLFSLELLNYGRQVYSAGIIACVIFSVQEFLKRYNIPFVGTRASEFTTIVLDLESGSALCPVALLLNEMKLQFLGANVVTENDAKFYYHSLMLPFSESCTIIFTDSDLISGMEQTIFLFQQAAIVDFSHTHILGSIVHHVCLRCPILASASGTLFTNFQVPGMYHKPTFPVSVTQFANFCVSIVVTTNNPSLVLVLLVHNNHWESIEFEPYVVGFGIIKIVDAGVLIYSSNLLVGSYNYLDSEYGYKMTDSLLPFGVEMLLCDTDMVWLKNPLPFLTRATSVAEILVLCCCGLGLATTKGQAQQIVKAEKCLVVITFIVATLHVQMHIHQVRLMFHAVLTVPWLSMITQIIWQFSKLPRTFFSDRVPRKFAHDKFDTMELQETFLRGTFAVDYEKLPAKQEVEIVPFYRGLGVFQHVHSGNREILTFYSEILQQMLQQILQQLLHLGHMFYFRCCAVGVLPIVTRNVVHFGSWYGFGDVIRHLAEYMVCGG